MAEIEMVVVYDNYPGKKTLQTAHGFACVVRAGERAVLFDTGGSGQILLENMEKLGLDPAGLEALVLSHSHWDHVGGLNAVLEQNAELTVYMPAVFPRSLIKDVRQRARSVIQTDRPHEVLPGVRTTDVLDQGIAEQAIYVETAQGIVVLTGCAHPGVVQLARSAKAASGREVHAVLGGFHMAGASVREIDLVIDGLRRLGAQRVGPCHCSGEKTRQVMREAFGPAYIEIGVGAPLSFAQAQSQETAHSEN
ncbi:MAG: MBL fold metallo-hydrolase [Planctomycetes bacterium]|nr:MBL fold metallo-hydrolase [Planctomycetota bacterium]